MSHRLSRGVFVLWIAAAAQAAAGQDAGPLAGWTFSNGPEFPGAQGRIAWNEKEGRPDPGCVEVQFNFDNGGNYVAAMFAVKPDEQHRRARLWLKKPGRNRVTFRATDSAGQTFQKFTDYQYPDWQQIEVDLSTWVHSWGGPKDGKVRWPITAFGVLLENDGDARRGSYFIDGLEMLPAEAGAPPETLRSWYAAATFAREERWQARRGIGWYEEGRVEYDIPQPGGSAFLAADFSLLGKPKRMRVRVESDGSGLELAVTIGSHFQNFRRTLGTLSRAGEQAFEVELGAMEGWDHADGENDGVARLPLRLAGLSLVRRGDRAAGTVRLLGIDVETEYTRPASVVVLPDPWVDGDTARFNVTVRNLGPKPIRGTLRFEGLGTLESIRTDQVPLQLEPKGVPHRHTFVCPMGGRDFVEGSFAFASDALRTPEVTATATRLPRVEKVATAAGPIGMGVYLYRFGSVPLRYAVMQMRKVAQMANQAGVRWTREEFSWSALEPQRGQWDWAFYDEMVKVAAENGLQIYGLLCYWPGYPEAASFAYTEKGIDEYVSYVVQVVRRYKGTIKHWEIWNEPNIFFWSGPKELYPRTLKAAYEAIKREDPDAQVLGCSTAGIDTSFIRMVMDAGAPFDILTIHPYRGTLHMPTFIDELKRTSELVGGRPVWITEMGWPTSLVGGVSERRQAGLVAQTYVSALASGVVGSVSWYDFRNDFDDPFYNESQFGVLRRDLRPKAGYLALMTVGRRLGASTLVGAVDVGADLLAHRFRDGRGDVVAVSPLDGDRPIALRISPPPRIVLDAVGQPVAAGPRRDGDALTLRTTLLDGWPLYIIGEAGVKVERLPPALETGATPAFVQPGESTTLDVKGPDGARVRAWRCPPGWTVQGEGRSVAVAVPADQTPGDVRVIAEVEDGGEVVYLPLTVSVRPAVLRIP